VPTGPRPPPAEVALGLERYATGSPGTGGRLKVAPEDFRVDEISLYPRPDPQGAFVVLRVEARDWEQHELVRALTGALGLPPGRVSWAGTKDRRAISTQLLSYRGAPVELPAEPFRGVRVLEQYRADRGLVLGHHFGNSFDLTVRETGLPSAELAARGAAVREELRAAGRFPNWFGLQRFGEVRPITHEVGRELLRGDPGAAVAVYLERVAGPESAEGRWARGEYAAHHDPLRALREFPPAYRFERILLDHLARGQDAARALRGLSRELRQLFVHAYQSWIFNRLLSARLSEGTPLDEPAPGDRLLRIARDGTVPGDDPIPVAADNLPEARALSARGRAVVAGPLVGTGTPLEGRTGELVRGMLAADGIAPASFALPRTPDLASEGTFRPLSVPVPPLDLRQDAEAGVGPDGYRLRFALPKGSYATVLVREFTKAGSLP
jgi:tRNA pseudouridine13 synthase